MVKKKKANLLLHFEKDNNNNNINDLLLPYSTLILKMHVLFKDENNTKSLVVSSEHAFS